MTRLSNRLLSKNLNRARLTAFAVADFIGLAIVMAAIHFYGDIKATLHSAADQNADYIVISKKIGTFGNTDRDGFTDNQIDSIGAQPWAEDVGRFESSRFDVNATVMMPGATMSTALFFESVPERFLDVTTSSFTFDDGDSTVPVILPKEYLALYNFGYASARNLPAISEAMLGMVPLKLTVSGNGMTETYRGRIAGFSSRINTIAVPENFIRMANSRFGNGDNDTPSRLIVKINPTMKHLIGSYLDSHDLETTTSGVLSRTDYILSVVTTGVVATGLIICGLSLFLLTLSIFLMLEKSRDKIRLLLMLGYTPGSIAAYYRRIVVALNTIVYLAALIVTAVADRLLIHRADAYLTIEHSSLLPSIAVGAALTAVAILINFVSIKKFARN